MALRFEPESGRGAAGIGQDRRAFGDHGLPRIDFRHHTAGAEALKTFLDVPQKCSSRMQLAAKEFRDGLAGAVVVGGPKAAGGDDQVGAIEGVAEGRAHLIRRVADHGFVNHTNAQLVELRGKKKELVSSRKGVSSSEPTAMISARMAADLTVQGKPLDVPVEGEESAVGGDHGAMRGKKRKPHDVAAAEHHFGFRLRV